MKLSWNGTFVSIGLIMMKSGKTDKLSGSSKGFSDIIEIFWRNCAESEYFEVNSLDLWWKSFEIKGNSFSFLGIRIERKGEICEIFGHF